MKVIIICVLFIGATEDGVEGFFKGIGKGLLGLITQPIGGVLDLVSLAFDGVRRSDIIIIPFSPCPLVLYRFALPFSLISHSILPRYHINIFSKLSDNEVFCGV